MNWRCLKKFPRLASWLGVVIYLFLCAPLRAEVEDRWLVIFDTSSEMKKRLPGTEATLKILLETSAAGQMQPNDSLGVWRFCQQLHTGEFPLTIWNPATASMTASNLVKFVHGRWYAGETRMAALQPALNQIIAASDRLTVLIFCDGTSEINWSPYDAALNQTFSQNFAERKKNQQPFVLLLRAQQGKIIGCTVNFPPGGITFPPFAPKPEPPKPAVITPVTPPPKPVPPVVTNTPIPSLIVVGKQVFTNLDDAKKITAPTEVPPATNPAVSAPTNQVRTTSNLAPVKPILTKTNTAKAIAPATNNSNPALPAKMSKAEKNLWLWVAGGIVLLAGLALVIGLVARSRRPINSLITDSLNVSKEPPPKK